MADFTKVLAEQGYRPYWTNITFTPEQFDVLSTQITGELQSVRALGAFITSGEAFLAAIEDVKEANADGTLISHSWHKSPTHEGFEAISRSAIFASIEAARQRWDNRGVHVIKPRRVKKDAATFRY